MYSIGQFSHIVRISSRMLRHYDEIGLLKPVYVDEDTQYRYYSPEQVEIATKIFILRDLNFPLKDVEQILIRIANKQDFSDLVKMHLDRIKENIDRETLVLNKLSQLLEPQMEVYFMANKIEEKYVDKMIVASIRRKGPYHLIGPMIGEICSKVGQYCSGAPIWFCHDNGFKPEDADLDVGVPISLKISVDGIEIKELPATKVIALKHIGPYEKVGVAYKVLLDYINDKGLKVVPPSREVYISDPKKVKSPNENITEVQFPIIE